METLEVLKKEIERDKLLRNNQYDAFSNLKCGDCAHCKGMSFMDGYESCPLCPVDHKHIRVAKPSFKSYDPCDCPICKNFEPSIIDKWLAIRWMGLKKYELDRQYALSLDKIDYHPFDFVKYNDANWGSPNKAMKTIGLVLDKNEQVTYYIPYEEYFNCSIDINNYLYKQYYKRTKNGCGYKLVTEYLGGRLVNANE